MCRDIHCIGSSGGACAACHLFLDVEVEKTVGYICDRARFARTQWLGPFKVREYVRGALRSFAPPDAGAWLPQRTPRRTYVCSTLLLELNLNLKPAVLGP